MSKIALVTGGSHNIGQGIAQVLAEKGYDVALNYHKRLEGAQQTQAAVEALGRKCWIYQANLEEPDGPEKLVNQVRRDAGRLDLMVCNAGIDSRVSILELTAEWLDRHYTNNYRNYLLCAGAAARHMVHDGIAGNIVFITSTRGEMAYPDDVAYSGLKAGITRACKSLALELSQYGIRVNCVAPGATWVHRPDREIPKIPFVNQSIPLKRTGTPRDIGEAVAFLASDAAGYITGTSLRVDGGLILPGLLEGYEAIPWVHQEWLDETRQRGMEWLEKSMQEDD